MSGDPYVYPGTSILRNRLDLRSEEELARAERSLVTQRMLEGVPSGDFDLDHLKGIHRHLFQDVYDWAGEIRTVEISKGGTRFQPRRYIGIGMADIHRRLVQAGFLRGGTPDAFAQQAGAIIGDINHVHPFREGNGRTQLQYLKLLGREAGHPVDLTQLTGARWIAASQEAHHGRYAAMARCIADALGRTP